MPQCLTPSVQAIHTHFHDATIEYQDRCIGSTKTELLIVKAGVTQPPLAVTPKHVAGDRFHLLANLQPGTQHCAQVRVHYNGTTLTSSQVCGTTANFGSATALRISKLDRVGAVSSSTTAFLGRSYLSRESKVHKIATKQGMQCRGIVVRNANGHLVARGSGCNGVSTFLNAGEHYAFYAVDGVSGASTPAQCSIEVDGTAIANVHCGWRAVGFSGLKASERLQAVHLPPQDFLPPVEFHVEPPVIRMVRLDTKGGLIVKNSAGNFVARGAEQAVSTATDHTVVLVGHAVDESVSIPVRIVRNDVALADRDGDGLGDQVEANAGLCDHASVIRNGFDCSKAYDQRDTDGDGISDLWEVVGRDAPASLVGKDQPLAYWGANPRHKDLFWEVDYAQMQPSDPAGLKFTVEAVRIAHAGFDFRAVVDDQIRRSANAHDLENPDGDPGISLHMDNGIHATELHDWTRHGHWGGYTRFVVRDQDCDKDSAGNVTSCNYAKEHDVWDTAMAQVRYGIFKWSMGYPFTGGRVGWGFPMGIGIGLNESGDPDPRRQADVLLHEGGHSLGLDHSGPYQADISGYRPSYDPEDGGFNCEPFYHSLLNYAYEGQFGNPGQAITFADSYVINNLPLNNTKLIERHAITHYTGGVLPSVTQEFFKQLRAQRYPVTAEGDVDWNRDGVISSGPVMAGSNRMGGHCDEARANRSHFNNRWNAAQSISAATMDGIVQLMGVDQGGVGWWAGVRFDAACTNFDPDRCATLYPAPGNPQPGDPGPWNPRNRVELFTNVTSLDVAVLDRPGAQRNPVAVALKSGTSLVHLRSSASATGDLGHWSAIRSFEVRHASSGAAIAISGEPELVPVPASSVAEFPVQERAKLFIRGANNQIYVAPVGLQDDAWIVGSFRPVFYTSIDNQFGALVVDAPVASVGGLHMYPYDAAPSTVVPGVTPKRVHLFVPKGGQVVVLAHVSGFEFVELGAIDTGEIQPQSKPVALFVGKFEDNADYGQLFLYYTRSGGVLAFSRAMSRPVANNPALTEYVVAPFGLLDHSGLQGAFVAATAEPGVDEQARVFFGERNLDEGGKPLPIHGKVVMVPRPENIYDVDMWGFNDWLTLKHMICYQVARGGDTKRSRVQELGGSPINCRPLPNRDPTHPGL